MRWHERAARTHETVHSVPLKPQTRMPNRTRAANSPAGEMTPTRSDADVRDVLGASWAAPQLGLGPSVAAGSCMASPPLQVLMLWPVVATGTHQAVA